MTAAGELAAGTRLDARRCQKVAVTVRLTLPRGRVQLADGTLREAEEETATADRPGRPRELTSMTTLVFRLFFANAIS